MVISKKAPRPDPVVSSDADTKIKGPPVTDTSNWLTRNEASDMLSCSQQTLANSERRGDLHPQFAYRPDGRGAEHRVIVYSPQELTKLAAKMRRHVIQPHDDGEKAARAFELLRQGLALDEIVIALRETPDRIDYLNERWLEQTRSRLVISPETKTAFEQLVGTFEDVTDLLELVRNKLGVA